MKSDQQSGGLPRLVREDGTVYLRVRTTLIDMHIVAVIVSLLIIALMELLIRTELLIR